MGKAMRGGSSRRDCVGRCEYQVVATAAGKDGMHHSPGTFAVDSCRGKVRIQPSPGDNVQGRTDDPVCPLGPRLDEKVKPKSYPTPYTLPTPLFHVVPLFPEPSFGC